MKSAPHAAAAPAGSGAAGTGSLIVEVEQISKRFGSLQAVDRVSFAVKRGEIFGLLGPNGAGKSTLIRMLTTLVPPTGGTARVDGHDVVREQEAVRMAIGVIPQAMTSDPDLTCEENLTVHARLYGMRPASRRLEVAASLLEAVDLLDRRTALAKTLSGGMRRRLEIARGLVHNPQILFLDEPTTGLDPVSRMSVWTLISKLRETQGLTLFLTTHYMDEADKLCDRLAIVDRGRIVVLDTPAALKASVPGAAVIEARIDPDWPEAAAEFGRLDGVRTVTAQGEALYRIVTDRGPQAAVGLVEFARARHVALQSLSVQSTSLDDVFVHFTGRGLAEAEASAPAAPARPGH
ncbi:MAG: ATP-binding cassette domain-containing protein [Acidobacteriota bacterium]|nr:ATP-binding cassette domain-containing protein [Acidobacteriota bacterium]